eukprot:334857-Chlamydomonas_euryale.AAC.5
MGSAGPAVVPLLLGCDEICAHGGLAYWARGPHPATSHRQRHQAHVPGIMNERMRSLRRDPHAKADGPSPPRLVVRPTRRPACQS